MRGGDIVAAVLQAQDVPFVFTLVGGHISPILVGAKAMAITAPFRSAPAVSRHALATGQALATGALANAVSTGWPRRSGRGA